MVADPAINDGDGDALSGPASVIGYVCANCLPEIIDRTRTQLPVRRNISNFRIGCESLYRAERQPEMSSFDRLQLAGERTAEPFHLAKVAHGRCVLELHNNIDQLIL